MYCNPSGTGIYIFSGHQSTSPLLVAVTVMVTVSPTCATCGLTETVKYPLNRVVGSIGNTIGVSLPSPPANVAPIVENMKNKVNNNGITAITGFIFSPC